MAVSNLKRGAALVQAETHIDNPVLVDAGVNLEVPNSGRAGGFDRRIGVFRHTETAQPMTQQLVNYLHT
jgi:hypothetical protein